MMVVSATEPCGQIALMAARDILKPGLHLTSNCLERCTRGAVEVVDVGLPMTRGPVIGPRTWGKECYRHDV